MSEPDGTSSQQQVVSEDLVMNSEQIKQQSLQTINFDYDSSRLTEQAKNLISANVKHLNAFPNISVRIEGHCDERGGREYNLALGEKRARAVKDYMIGLGIYSSRLSVISFGKENPINYSHNLSAWAENRRANFAIVQE